MRTEAVFNSHVNGYWVGKTRAGNVVKLKDTPEVTEVIEKSFGNVVTIEISKEAVELAKNTKE